MIKTGKMPSLYLPHGGGPCFFMEWTMGPADTWFALADFLKQLSSSLSAKPKALLVISAHWEAEVITIMSAPNPPLLFDYYGFPKDTYKIEYPAPGFPQLAEQINDLFAHAGISTKFETKRGYDHGVFIPLKLVFPDADIPIVQVSLKAGLDASEHLKIGQILAPLRDEGVLIIGSGMSFHNLHHFFSSGSEGTKQSRAFDDWLGEVVSLTDPSKRNESLNLWQNAPFAKFAHPREEHLIPLMVAAGAGADDAGTRIFQNKISDIFVSGYRFG